MKITAVRHSTLENPQGSARANRLDRAPELRRIQYTRRGIRLGLARQASIELPIAATEGAYAR